VVFVSSHHRYHDLAAQFYRDHPSGKVLWLRLDPSRLERMGILPPSEEVALRLLTDRGVPAVAWQPMTVAQRDAGVSAYEWGLLVGYDEQERSYVVRHQHYRTEYEVPFDQFGYTDPVNWYYVLVPGVPRPVDPRKAAVRALGNAVDFAYGRRFKMEDACYYADAVGFAAYELWREAFRSGKVNVRFAPEHAGILRWLRARAAEYLREVAAELPEAREMLEAGAVFYEREVEIVKQLQDLGRQGAEADGFTGAMRQSATELLDAALKAERGAVGKIEIALAALAPSPGI
jgi:hypothetical protein